MVVYKDRRKIPVVLALCITGTKHAERGLLTKLYGVVNEEIFIFVPDAVLICSVRI